MSKGKNKTAIVIDDNAATRETLRHILRSIDIDVIREFNDSDGAVAALEVLMPHYAFIDINMPNLSGFDILKKLNERHHNILVFIITGSPSLEHVQQAIQHGASGFVVKPFNIKNILQNINKAQDVIQRTQSKYDLW